MTPVELERGLEAIRTGKYFEAHEELELAWRAAAPEERDFFQGLVHVAVAWYQAGRGNPVGCGRQLEKAERRLSVYAPSHRGVDVASLLAQVEGARAVVAAGSLELEPRSFRTRIKMNLVSPEHAIRRDPASSVAPIALLFPLPASLSRTRPAHSV